MSGSILCAVDIAGDHRDDAVLAEAVALAKLKDASLDVVTVVPTHGITLVSSYFDENFQKEAVEAANKRLHEFTATALGDDTGIAIRHVVATGSVYEEILELAKQTNPSLIIIGAHKPDLKDYLLGPNAARVVRHSTCSVFVVRD